MREHRRDESGDVRRECASLGAVIERRSSRDEVRHVCDVHPGAKAFVLLADGDRVVEVLRRLGIDRERRQLAEVNAAFERRLRCVVRLELGPRFAVDEQAFENRFDVVSFSEHSFEPRPAATGSNDREITAPGLAQSLAVEDERDPGHEVRLADDKLAALCDLDDNAVAQC